MGDIVTRAIENNLGVQRTVQEAVVKSHNECNKNTRKNYEGKQQEWINWCTTREFTDGSIVTQSKILLFLEEVVQPCGSRKSVNGVVVPLSSDGLQGYVKALVDLYNIQQSLGTTPLPHPRGKALSAILSDHKRKRSDRKRKAYQDHGEGTVQDTYNRKELKRIAVFFMGKGSRRSLRDRLDLLIGHALMVR